MADNEKLERLLDELQSVTARKVELFAKAQELQSMIDLMDKKQELLRNDIMSLFKQDVVEEPDPNLPQLPVRDVFEVEMPAAVKKGKGWVMKLKNAKRVHLQNLITKEERDFESKTDACKFLDVALISLNRSIKDGGRIKDWTVTVVSPTA